MRRVVKRHHVERRRVGEWDPVARVWATFNPQCSCGWAGPVVRSRAGAHAVWKEHEREASR